jgi:hypothetical protein
LELTYPIVIFVVKNDSNNNVYNSRS